MKNVIGVLPAAGYGRRLGHTPCSKEVMSLGVRRKGERVHHIVPIASILECFSAAGIEMGYIITRPDKWDIPNFIEKNNDYDIKISYVLTLSSLGVPYTIDEAYPFLRGSYVALGFPDILLKPKQIFLSLLQLLEVENVDVMLGLFPARDPEKVDMVKVKDNMVQNISVKPYDSNLKYTWVCAVWRPSFSDYMHSFVSNRKSVDKEVYMGDIFQGAIDEEKFKIGGIPFEDGKFIDIGTPDDLNRAMTVRW